MCVLERVEGAAAVGGIVCETNCEILMIHKAMLQRYTYTGTSEFQEGLKRRAPIYPEDNKLLDDMKEAEE